MLITFFLCLFITALCWTWGLLTIDCLNKTLRNNNDTQLHFSITCFVGLAAVTTFSSVLSLFMPLGDFFALLLITLPCIFVFFLKSFKQQIKNLKAFFFNIHVSFILLFLVCLILVLFMNSWYINNEDTLGYHAQIIQWIEKYKAVPGIAHLHARYGLQNSWFVSCALFSFSFLKTHALTFINSAVLAWYLFFVISKANKNLFNKNILHAFLWIILLLFSLWSYTQVRLAATTASPDFIATLYTWLLFYLLITHASNKNSISLALIAILSIFTITIKLSAALVIILAIYSVVRLLDLKKLKTAILCILCCTIILSSFVARNIISSGYPAFPSTFPDIVNTDWKFKKENGELIQNYITAYARIKSKATVDDIEKIVSMKLSEWVPGWWKNQSLADKSIIAITILSFLFLLTRIKKIIQSNWEIKIALATALTGIVFWFVKAPDPRFGFGFLITVPAIASGCFMHFNNNTELYWKKILIAFVLLMGVALSGYIVYRVINFFSPSQFVSPNGIRPVNYKTVKCNGTDINIPVIIYGCGSTDIPCAYDSCKTFEPRGTKITDGFRAK